MKAEEIFEKRAVFMAGENRCMDLCFFKKALADYKQSIIGLIDEIIRDYSDKLESPEPQSTSWMIRWETSYRTLTELKQKIEEL